MLNMGFREDIETVLEYLEEEHQTVLFSATMPKPILEITKKYQKDAVTIKITKKELTVKNIEQYYLDLRRKDKLDVLTRLLEVYDPKLSLVFCNTKRGADEVTKSLQDRGYMAESLHGDMRRQQRDMVMRNFRNGRTEILVATDVAARGIDVDDVEAVFNYDLPQDDEYYVHRIGRTGRAGRTGKAFSFIKGKEIYKLKDIMRYCKTKIVAMPIPSRSDVEEAKVDKIMEQLERIIEEQNLTRIMNTLEEEINNSDYSAMEIAAAFMYQALGKYIDEKLAKQMVLGVFGDTGAQDGMVRLFINIGKKHRVRPGDILGAIAGESGMEGNLVGAIDMYDGYTFVEVPMEYGLKVINAMKSA